MPWKINRELSISSDVLWSKLQRYDNDHDGTINAAELRQAADTDGTPGITQREADDFAGQVLGLQAYTEESRAIRTVLTHPDAVVAISFDSSVPAARQIQPRIFASGEELDAYYDSPESDALLEAARSDIAANGNFSFSCGLDGAGTSQAFVRVGRRQIELNYTGSTGTLTLSTNDGSSFSEEDKQKLLSRFQVHGHEHVRPLVGDDPDVYPDTIRYQEMYAALQRWTPSPSGGGSQ